MIKKISDKDKQDWQNFIDSSDKLENKDNHTFKKHKQYIEKTIDLHGYTLEKSNELISQFIEKCYLENIVKIKVITGKGSRSKNKSNPYLSEDLSILKYSVPNYIKNNSELMKKVKELDFDSVNDVSQGTFNIFLKKKI